MGQFLLLFHFFSSGRVLILLHLSTMHCLIIYLLAVRSLYVHLQVFLPFPPSCKTWLVLGCICSRFLSYCIHSLFVPSFAPLSISRSVGGKKPGIFDFSQFYKVRAGERSQLLSLIFSRFYFYKLYFLGMCRLSVGFYLFIYVGEKTKKEKRRWKRHLRTTKTFKFQ